MSMTRGVNLIRRTPNVCFLDYCCWSVGNDLKMCSSGRNEGPTVVVVNKSHKSSSHDDDDERKEQVEDRLVANEKTIEMPTWNDGSVDRFVKDVKCPKKLTPTWRVVEESHSTPT